MISIHFHRSQISLISDSYRKGKNTDFQLNNIVYKALRTKTFYAQKTSLMNFSIRDGFFSPHRYRVPTKVTNRWCKNFINKNIPRRAKTEHKAPIRSFSLFCLRFIYDASGRFKCAVSFVNIRRAAAAACFGQRRVIRKKRPRNAATAKQVTLISFVFAPRRRIRFLVSVSQPAVFSAPGVKGEAAYRNSVCRHRIEIHPFQSTFLCCVCWYESKQNFHRNQWPGAISTTPLSNMFLDQQGK